MGKYKAYPEYKDSGVEWLGEVPRHWEMRKLKRTFKIKKQIAGTLGFDVLSVTQRGIKIKNISSGEGQLSQDYSKYQRVSIGDFAMNHMDLLTGYIDISKYEGVTSPDYRVFSLRDEKHFNAKYYLYILQMCYSLKLFFHLGQGSAHLGRWRLPTEAFNEISFPVPSFLTQSEIVNFLDSEVTKIDTLIEKQQKLIQLLKEKRQVVISHAVTKGLNPDAPMKDSGVEWLGEVPEHWNTSKLKHLTKQIVDGAHFTPTYTDKGIPFLRVTDIHAKEINRDNVKFIPNSEHQELIKRCKPQNGDLLVSKNGTIGIPKLVDWDWDFSIFVSLCLIKFSDKMNAEYAFFFFKTYQMQEQIFGQIKKSTVINLHLDKIAKFVFTIPPINEQKEIVAHLNQTIGTYDKQVEKAEQMSSLLKERRTALISAAVTGKIDVRDWQPPENSSAAEA